MRWLSGLTPFLLPVSGELVSALCTPLRLVGFFKNWPNFLKLFYSIRDSHFLLFNARVICCGMTVEDEIRPGWRKVEPGVQSIINAHLMGTLIKNESIGNQGGSGRISEPDDGGYAAKKVSSDHVKAIARVN